MSASQEVVSKPEETNEYPTKGGRPEQHRLKHALEGRCFRFNSWVFPGIWTLRGWYLGPHKIHLKISTSTWRFIRICGVFCHICMHVSISTRISVWYMYDVLFEFVWYVTSKATSFAHFAIHITFFSPLISYLALFYSFSSPSIEFFQRWNALWWAPLLWGPGCTTLELEQSWPWPQPPPYPLDTSPRGVSQWTFGGLAVALCTKTQWLSESEGAHGCGHGCARMWDPGRNRLQHGKDIHTIFMNVSIIDQKPPS